MLYLIDTCFWKHCEFLFEKTKIDLRIVLQNLRWGYTNQIKKEYLNYNLQKFIPLKSGYLIPISDEEIDHNQIRKPFIKIFDLPDQTLAFVAERDNAVLLTDDSDLLFEVLSWGINCYRLPVYCLKLVEIGLIKKKTVAQSLRFWEENGLYEKQDIRNWKSNLQQIC